MYVPKRVDKTEVEKCLERCAFGARSASLRVAKLLGAYVQVKIWSHVKVAGNQNREVVTTETKNVVAKVLEPS